MPTHFVVEPQNLPAVVRGWLKAANLADEPEVEIVFTDSEVLLRKPHSESLRKWAEPVVDEYDRAFRRLAGLE
ncbi:MAG: hypothetical protein RLZZ297_1514 [Chloroflexota bacterium]|jgi:hypothetical protein